MGSQPSSLTGLAFAGAADQRAHTNQTPQEMTRLQSLLSAEEAVLFEAARQSMSAFSRWRFGGRPLATKKGSMKRRLDGARVNGH